MQTSQGRHGLIVDAGKGFDLALELVNPVAAIRWQLLQELPYIIQEFNPFIVKLFFLILLVGDRKSPAIFADSRALW